MAAITADTTTLAKLRLETGLRARPVRAVHTAPGGFEGEGFPVRRAFAGVDLRDLDPFIHMDQMGEVDYAPYEPKGTDWHPHRGFETVTYILEGAFQHQDSHGGGGLIANGATQWMTAGSGILHIETPPEALVVSGGLFHGVQLWVNLRAADKMSAPRYQNLEGEAAGLVASPDGGVLLRIIAGELPAAADAPARGPGSTHTPITMVHATLAPGAQLELPWRNDFNALAYALAGEGTIGSDRRPFQSGQLGVFSPARPVSSGADWADRAARAVVAALDLLGDELVLQAHPQHSLDVLLIGGRSIAEPVATYGPFVMNTRAEIAQAMEDFQAGRLGSIPAGGLRPYRRR